MLSVLGFLRAVATCCGISVNHDDEKSTSAESENDKEPVSAEAVPSACRTYKIDQSANWCNFTAKQVEALAKWISQAEHHVDARNGKHSLDGGACFLFVPQTTGTNQGLLLSTGLIQSSRNIPVKIDTDFQTAWSTGSTTSTCSTGGQITTGPIYTFTVFGVRCHTGCTVDLWFSCSSHLTLKCCSASEKASKSDGK